MYYVIYSVMQVQRYTIDKLIGEWKERKDKASYYSDNEEYNIALGECIHDLEELRDSNIAEEEYFKIKMKSMPTEEEIVSLWADDAIKEQTSNA